VFRVQIAATDHTACAQEGGASPGASLSAREARGRHNLSWLVQLHWWAIVGQAAIILCAQAWTQLRLPVAAVGLVLGGESVGNLALGAVAKRARVTDGVIAAVMVIDAAVLTVLLDLTGGAANPFSALYLVNVALAAVLLPPRWSWLVLVASLASYGALFVHERFAGPSHHILPSPGRSELVFMHVEGMWVALAIAAAFVVFFVQQVTSALAARERELREARARGEKREKLASLATLAAGAAHELSTPLSTIAIVAKELQHSLKDSASAEVREDLLLVREQVARCREILDRMSAHAGANMGEAFTTFGVRAWVASGLEGLVGRDRVRIEIEPSAEPVAISGPPRALAETLRGLLKNAIQASRPTSHVTLRASAAGGRVRASVVDRGRGIPPDVLARVGEPFFTTKVPGEGMGLGLFLTRSLAEQLGGEFRITSNPGAGTEATIELPARQAGERGTE
jgi:two-component system sensor histidine kinase RegB